MNLSHCLFFVAVGYSRGNCTRLRGIADRRLGCPANGMEENSHPPPSKPGIGENLKFDDQRRVEAFANPIRVAALIRQHTGRADSVVHVVVRVPVDPEGNAAPLD